MPLAPEPTTEITEEERVAQQQRCQAEDAPDWPGFDDTMCDGMFDLDGPGYEKFLNDLGDKLEKESLKKS